MAVHEDMTDHDVKAIADRVETAILARVSRWFVRYGLPAVITNGVLLIGVIWWLAVMDYRVAEHQKTLDERAVAVAKLSILETQVHANTQSMAQAMRDIREALNRIEDRQFQDRRASNGREREGRQ